MVTARLGKNGRVTIPKAFRDAAGLRPGDMLAFDVEGGGIVVCKVSTRDHHYLGSVERTLTEWASSQDDEAWRDL